LERGCKKYCQACKLNREDAQTTNDSSIGLRTSAQLCNRLPIGYNGTPQIHPQNCPFPFDITTPSNTPSLDQSHSPSQMASRSIQSFCHRTLSGPTDRQTHCPEDGLGDRSVRIPCMLAVLTESDTVIIHRTYKLLLLLLLLLLRLFNGLFSRTTWVRWHQKGKQSWISMKKETVGWQWHQLDHMQIICTSIQTDSHDSTSSLSFSQARCPSCHPTNSVRALKAKHRTYKLENKKNAQIRGIDSSHQQKEFHCSS